jgi:hypothetical protein
MGRSGRTFAGIGAASDRRLAQRRKRVINLL